MPSWSFDFPGKIKVKGMTIFLDESTLVVGLDFSTVNVINHRQYVRPDTQPVHKFLLHKKMRERKYLWKTLLSVCPVSKLGPTVENICIPHF
jgi:hypothetical protein